MRSDAGKGGNMSITPLCLSTLAVDSRIAWSVAASYLCDLSMCSRRRCGFYPSFYHCPCCSLRQAARRELVRVALHAIDSTRRNAAEMCRLNICNRT